MTTLSKQKFYNENLLPRPVYKLPPSHLEVQKWFHNNNNINSLDSKLSNHNNYGKLNAKDLQMAFETFQGRHYSDASCKFVVRLFDLDKNGGIDIEEFENLYHHIKAWVNAFNQFDRNRSGFLDEKDLDSALKSMELNFTQDFVRFLITRNDPVARRIALDQFIVTCVQIQKFGEEFLRIDEKHTGIVTLKYEQFLEMILKCI